MVGLLDDRVCFGSEACTSLAGAGADHLFSTAALTDATGTVVERYAYDAYGSWSIDGAENASSKVANNYGFTGRRWDAETDLWYFRARYYDDGLGRFISRDEYDYVNGFSLYLPFFVPGALDPTGYFEILNESVDTNFTLDFLVAAIDVTGSVSVVVTGEAGVLKADCPTEWPSDFEAYLDWDAWANLNDYDADAGVSVTGGFRATTGDFDASLTYSLSVGTHWGENSWVPDFIEAGWNVDWESSVSYSASGSGQQWVGEYDGHSCVCMTAEVSGEGTLTSHVYSTRILAALAAGNLVSSVSGASGTSSGSNVIRHNFKRIAEVFDDLAA